jgi:soluble lytic murein transglycosylase-like protein
MKIKTALAKIAKALKQTFIYTLALIICALALAQLVQIGIYTALPTIRFIVNPYEDVLAAMPDIKVIEKKVEEAPKELTKEEVQDKIKFYAKMFGVNPDTALRIAKCESNFNPKAENINGSATGVFQFIRKTWKDYCHGDVYDADANIICFMRYYPTNSSWWECKG